MPKNNVLHEKTAIKREHGMDFPPRDYAYVPDPLRPATWRLRLTEAPGQISLAQLTRAAAALSPQGFQGNRLEIPPTASSSVKRRLLAEFRRLKVGEAQIPPHIKSVDVGSKFMVWKDIRSGLLRWLTVYSNNFRDQDHPPEIIVGKSHERYVTLVDSGLVDYPELWLWHTPGTTWGKADWVAYSDGFALASGVVYPGFEKIAENVANYKDLKVSHGMPMPFLLYDENAGDEIIYHITMEISVLPGASAANKLTGFAVIGKGDISMALPKAKKEFLEDVGLEKEVIERLENGLKETRQAAQAAGMESKERSQEDTEDEDFGDSEDDEFEEDTDGEDEDEDEGEDEEDAEGEDEEEGDTAEKARRLRSNDKRVNWNSDENPKPRRRKKPAADTKVNWNSDKNPPHEKRVNWNSDENPKPRRKKPAADTKVNWNSDKNPAPNEKRVNWNSDENPPRRGRKKKEDNPFVTRDEVADVIVEVAAPLIEGNQALSDAVGNLIKEVKMLRKEVTRLKASDEEKLARTKELTPTASLGDIIRQRVIGQDAAKVKGNTRLGMDGPKETEYTAGVQPTGVSLINGFINSAHKLSSQG